METTQNKLEVIKISCNTIEDRKVTCEQCKEPLYLWYDAKADAKEIELCISCKEAVLPDHPKVGFQALNNFFLVLFEESLKLKRAGDILMVTNTNRRVIEGGLVSRQLTLQYLRPLIESGVEEALIEKALEFSLKTQDPKRFLKEAEND